MGDENPIRTLGDYSKPSHEGYRNTIELPVGNYVIFYDHVNPVTRRTIDQLADGKLRDLNTEESWALLEDLGLYDNESWNGLRDFAKPVKAIAMPKIGPHDTQYCMEDPEQAFVEYASLRTDEAGEGLVSEFMASQDARLSKFEAYFKQQQRKMTNKIDTVLKAITDRIAGTLPSDTVKNPKLGTTSVFSARSYPTEDLQCSTYIHSSINAITIHPKQPEEFQDNEPDVGQEEKFSLGNINSNPHSQPDPLASIAIEQDDGEVMFIEIIRDDDEPQNEIPNEGFSSNLKIPCNIGHVHVEKAYIDLNSPLNIMTRMMYNWIMRRKLDPMENTNGGISNFTGRIKGMHVFIGNFTYVVDFMIVEDISSIIDPRFLQVVQGRPFIEISNMTHDPPEGVVRFTNRNGEVAYKMPHKIEQYNSLSNLEKELTKLVNLRNKEDKRRGVDYVMSKILGFYKECLELGPEYVTGLDDEGEVK
ncbi:hypothetical protein Tco_0216999 [Tanacetum coccineum]